MGSGRFHSQSAIGRIAKESALNLPDPAATPIGVPDPTPARDSMEVLEQENNIVVRAQFTGVNPAELEVRITDTSVTVRGERKRELGQHHRKNHRRERSVGSFSRKVSLPHRVDSAQAKAVFQNGLLQITAPKLPPDRRGGRTLDIEVL